MAATKRAAKTPNSIHQLKVTLLGIRPPVWRRIQVPSDVTLARLHDILQMTMGWHDSHLHQFRVGETTYGDPGILEDLDVRNERTARLNQVALGEKHKLYYEYDFGDGWEHEIIRDPEHDEHESMMEWLGGDFDPEAFDVEVINQRLAYVR